MQAIDIEVRGRIYDEPMNGRSIPQKADIAKHCVCRNGRFSRAYNAWQMRM